MTKEKKEHDLNEKISLTGYHPVETPEEIMAADKDTKRKEAFKEAYKKVMTIIPEYFLAQKRKKKSTSGGTGGNAFTQNIIVTSENVKVEMNQEAEEQVQEEKGRERDD